MISSNINPDLSDKFVLNLSRHNPRPINRLHASGYAVNALYRFDINRRNFRVLSIADRESIGILGRADRTTWAVLSPLIKSILSACSRPSCPSSANLTLIIDTYIAGGRTIICCIYSTPWELICRVTSAVHILTDRLIQVDTCLLESRCSVMRYIPIPRLGLA